MPWFKVDDAAPFSPQLLAAGNAAAGLWMLCGSWSAGADTAGLIPHDIARRFGSRREIRRLLNAGLWCEEGDVYAMTAEGLWDIDEQRHRRKIPRFVRAQVLARDEHRCQACGTGEALQIDHVFPWSLGGADVLGNLQILCAPCNRAKGARVS